MDAKQKHAFNLLENAGLFFGKDDEEEDRWAQTLNMNDVWGWALAYGEYVPDEELPHLAKLYETYGWCGVVYWVSERNDQMKSEFADINRFVEFVRNEESIKLEEPSSSKRAYLKKEYTIGS